ncbi:MAG: diguanylate cyclase [Actinomycetia bacterium]|nr:diguanylate cyclase [Actinomycetes bacterium]
MAEPSTSSTDEWGRAVFWPQEARWRGGISFLVIFCAYSFVLSLDQFVSPHAAALLWLPNAVLVTALLRFRPSDWLYVYSAGLLAEVIGDLTLSAMAPHHALVLGVANASEATLVVLVAALIAGSRRSIGLLSIRGALSLVVGAVTVPALTGTLGAFGLVWAFDIDYLETWRSWWFGDSLGILVGVPFGLLLRDTSRSVARHRSTAMVLVGSGVAAVLFVVSIALALTDMTMLAPQVALANAVLLSLLFGAVGAPPAAALATISTLIAISRHGDPLASLVRDQILVVLAFTAVYAIASAIESADRSVRQLSDARKDLETANERLKLLSRTDELTGLSNRRALAENLGVLWASCVRESKPVAMLMVDIDWFHHYNGTYGHVAGDEAIKRIASVVKGFGSKKTDIVVRYGGEEFLIILPSVTLDYAEKTANQIHQQVQDLNIEHSSSPVAPIVTVSIGVLAQAVATPDAAISAVHRCDELLYQAKETGRNQIVAEQHWPDSTDVPRVDGLSF